MKACRSHFPTEPNCAFVQTTWWIRPANYLLYWQMWSKRVWFLSRFGLKRQGLELNPFYLNMVFFALLDWNNIDFVHISSNRVYFASKSID